MTAKSSNPVLAADVLIIGGGLVGGVMAASLAQNGIRTIVIDSEDPARAVQADFDGRTVAIAAAPQKVLKVAGIWDEIEAEAGPILDIRVSDGESLMFLHYDHSEVGSDPFGWIVENRCLRRAIYKRLDEMDEVTLLAPARIAELRREAQGVTAILADGREIRAQMVIGAEGRNSFTRDQAGIGVTNWRYGQSAIVCTIAHDKPHDQIAHERFLPAGPFAILPMTGNRCSIVWTEKEHLAPAILKQDDAAFLAELRWRVGDFLGDLRLVGPRFAHPLSLQFADAYTAPRLAIIGDAAHGMHPVAGQGMNYGLRDVAALAEILVEAQRLGLDLGSAAVLERYQKLRRFDNLLILGLTDGLVRLFSNDIAPLRLARDFGLAAVNRIGPLKRLFMRHAMGQIGELPRMLRGEPL